MIEPLLTLSHDLLRMNDRPYRRALFHENPFTSRFSILLGQRGVGKTTLIAQYLMSKYKDNTSDKMLFVQADHFLVGGMSLYEIAEEFRNLGGESICFDEIHKYPEWSRELKSIYDTFPTLTVIASGSSSLEIGRGSHDLSRRAVVSHMQGMSFREYIELSLGCTLPVIPLKSIITGHAKAAETILRVIRAQHKTILALFRNYLEQGYYPYFNEINDTKLFHITIEQQMHTTLENDLVAVQPSITGVSVKRIKKLLSIIARSVPFTPDLKALKQLLDIGDERTLKLYLKYLEDAGLIRTCSGAGKGLRVLERPEKIYLNNTNQAYAIGGEHAVNRGNIRETFFASAVSPQHALTLPKTGDFIVDGRYLFEIGGKNKGLEQIRNTMDAFLALDDIESGAGNKIPLWLFGFLY